MIEVVISSYKVFGKKYSGDKDIIQLYKDDQNTIIEHHNPDVFEYHFANGDALLRYMDLTHDKIKLGSLNEATVLDFYGIDMLDPRIDALFDGYNEYLWIDTKIYKKDMKRYWQIMRRHYLVEMLMYKLGGL
jgi:hypothetical protein